MSPTITSLKNPKIKDVIKLGKRSVRDAARMTVVEGGREISLALSASLVPRQVFVCTPLVDETSRSVAGRCATLAERGLTSLQEVSPDVFAKLAYRGDSGGLVAEVPYPTGSLSDVEIGSHALVLVVEGAEKPGNLGALLRTADAAGVDVVIACGPGTDVYNPNVVRASLGALFTVPTFQASVEEAVSWLREHKFAVIAASPDADQEYTCMEMRSRTAIAVGSEAHGLSSAWLAAGQRVRIPMYGRVDSLNLSASAAILLYEAVRQRCASQSAGQRSDQTR